MPRAKKTGRTKNAKRSGKHKRRPSAPPVREAQPSQQDQTSVTHAAPIRHTRLAAVAAERDILLNTVAVERAERMAAYGVQLQRLNARVATRALTASSVVRILAEGDSWFDYPVVGAIDTIEALKRLIKLPIANMAHHGDEVRQMLSLRQRKEIQKRLSTGADDGQPWDAMLFSGGGNDFVGDQLCIWLRSYVDGMSASDVVDSQRFDAVLEIVMSGYRDLIDIRDTLSVDTKLFFHQYDFAPPNNKGVCGVGPWLRPSLDFRQIPPSLQPEVVTFMLKRFAEVLSAAAHGIADVYVVETQGTFEASSSKWWANELHPTNRGFKAIAEKFRDALQEAFPQLS